MLTAGHPQFISEPEKVKCKWLNKAGIYFLFIEDHPPPLLSVCDIKFIINRILSYIVYIQDKYSQHGESIYPFFFFSGGGSRNPHHVFKSKTLRDRENMSHPSCPASPGEPKLGYGPTRS